MMPRLFTEIFRDETGATIVEFALISPVLVLTLMGLFDLSYNFYAETMIEGAIQKAARDSTLEAYAGNGTALDTRGAQCSPECGAVGDGDLRPFCLLALF